MKFDLGYINKLIALSVNFDGEKTTLHFHELKKKKGEIVFGKTVRFEESLESFAKKIGKHTPVVLHFSGKGIINRSVDNKENYRHSLLMNADLNQFYFTDYIQDEQVYSSVIRKDVVQEFIDQLVDLNIDVISISSGPFVVSPLASYVAKSSIDIDGTQLLFTKDQLTNYSKLEEQGRNTQLGAELIRTDQIGAVSTAAQFFNPSPSLLLPEDEQINSVNLNEAKQKNIFVRFGVGMVFFFLTILASNYFYLGHLNSIIESNSLELLAHEDQLGELSFLTEEKERKEKLLSSSGLLNKKFLSFYLMELSNAVPDDIVLNSMVISPLVKEIKKRHKIEFQNEFIYVTGQSKSSDILSRWIDDLKENDWLSKVDILDYSYEKGVGNFELEILVF